MSTDDNAVRADWPLYEVFLRGKRGLNHVHVGSLHAADDEMAVRHARDVYTRRNEGVSIWVVRSSSIVASSPSETRRLLSLSCLPCSWKYTSRRSRWCMPVMTTRLALIAPMSWAPCTCSRRCAPPGASRP